MIGKQRAVFFLGREHHAAKMMSLMISMSNAGWDVRVLVADNSINIDPATEYLAKYGIPLNVVDHLNGYLDGYVPEPPIVPPPISVPPFWFFSSYEEARRDLYAARAYFDTHNVDHFFVLHENNFFTKILLYAAKQYGVHTYAFQEGIILKREEEDLQKYSGGDGYADIVFSWVPEDAEFYDGRSEIITTGPPHLDMWAMRRNDDDFASTRYFHRTNDLRVAPDKIVVLFAPPRFPLYAGNPLAAIRQLVDWTLVKGYQLVLKLHPFDTSINNIRNLYKGYTNVTIPDRGIPIERYICGAELVVTQVSTVAMEAALLGVPVVEWDRDYFGLEQSLSDRFEGVKLVKGEDIDAFDELITGGLFPATLDGTATKKIIQVVASAK